MIALPYKRTFILLFLIKTALLAFSLKGATPEDDKNKHKVVPGSIMDSIFCKNDSNQFYAVYVPSTYDKSKSWPIIYIFEPAARAKLPLMLYKELAETHELILACSYNSRNGPILNNENAYQKMSDDINSWLNIDLQDQLTSGFSGGGRFSQLVAQNNPNISGVIAVAGPRGDGALFNEQAYITPYVGIVGNRDMNYLEHTKFQQTLVEMGVKNTLITYNAAHQWPPKEIYDQAILWHLGLHEYNVKMNEPSKLKSYINLRTQYLDTTQAMSNVEKYKSYQAILKNFKDFNHSTINERILDIESEKKFDKAFKQEEKILKNEEEEQIALVKALNEFRSYFFIPNFEADSGKYSLRWWKSEIGQISGKVSPDNSKGLSAARLIDFLRGQVHNQVQSAKTFNNPKLVLSMHELNLYLYPNSIWFLWNQSILCAQFNQKEEAMDHLKKAKKINIKLLHQIQQNPAFNGLKSQYSFLYD
ncbi:MAG: hypothetical protein ABJH98_01885 [Reichenbachiella sp.]|uniref:hypothetical protein n=1 Tax=Reichenbachiella sp. TaxID=2184521 RepID=UPI003298F4DA